MNPITALMFTILLLQLLVKYTYLPVGMMIKTTILYFIPSNKRLHIINAQNSVHFNSYSREGGGGPKNLIG